MSRRIAIIGAGPIGIEAALAARQSGYAVEVFERGELASSVRQWGHVRMFSPFAMNVSAAGCAVVRASGRALPHGEELLTGEEFVERYLRPLAEGLEVPIHTGAEVLRIGRLSALKMEKIGTPHRGETPFRLLIREGERERYVEADLIFDCSGTFLTPNPLGDGGLPALGESALPQSISYGMPRADALAGKSVLVVGAGHSAATLVRDLAIPGGAPISWAVRKSAAEPCPQIADDPLECRSALAAAVNGLARSGRVRLYRGTVPEALERSDSQIEVRLRGAREDQPLKVDHILCATGFRPDPSLARELQTQTCWATEGTYPLAASLLGEAGGDCLATPAFGAETLRHPEPGYFTLGMKSYGRAPDFLLRTGLQQIASLLQWLERENSHGAPKSG